MTARRALVASDSNVAGDPRVLKQIRWLVQEGWTVDSLGRGDLPPEVNGVHHKMHQRPYLMRVLANVLLPRRARYAVLVASTVPPAIDSAGPKYELAVLNEIELLPWFSGVRHNVVAPAPAGWVHLDLHEYAPSQRSGVVHNLLFKKYRAWQTKFIASNIFNSRSVVSPGIAGLYSDLFPIPAPAVIRSVTDLVEQPPSPVDPHDIKLIHHGNASATRGLELMIDAMADIDERFSLHLMLVGSSKVVQDLRRRAHPLGTRVQFHDPVNVRDVARALNSYDLEVIFFPPVTENLRFALPNKLFESVQGRVGIVLGRSPDMVELVNEYGIGAVSDGWTAQDLAKTVNSLTAADVERFKAASHRAASELNSDAEKQRFMAAMKQPGSDTPS